MNKQEAIETIKQDKIQVGRFTEITREVNAIRRKIEMVDYVPLETVVSVIDKINEQEKLYTVEIPNPNGVVVCLERLDGGKIALSTLGESRLTESEIKKNFEWAWQWAREVEDE